MEAWGLFFGIITALLAAVKKRNVLVWFVAGFFFHWFALIILLLIPDGSGRFFRRGHRSRGGAGPQWRRRVTRACPYCGSHITFDDIPGTWTCPRCGRTFIYGTDGEVHRPDEDEGLVPQIAWIVKLFAKMAKHDGVVSENEVRQVDQIVRRAFQPTRPQLRKIMALFNEARYSEESFASIARNLYASVRGRRDILSDMIIALFAIAAADGALRAEEEEMIRTAAAIFGLSGDYESLKRQFFGQAGGASADRIDLDACYQLLGCTAADSDQTIKKHYRALIKENHPDRLMSSGASEAAIKAANDKIKKIKQAYEQIMNARAQ